MMPAYALPLFAAVAAAVVLATGVLLGWLRRRQILDRPNERSSHSRPTPRGGGLAVMAVVLPREALVFQGVLPLPLDRLLAGLCWLW
ncbi:MAG: glycosyl transferase, partial [Caenispirillum sp.]|nr:glycosyl transferase [Caenispirillum sp.]